MKNWKEIIHQQTFRYIDHTTEKEFAAKPYTAMTSFAVDDALATSISDGQSPPAIRLWVHPNTVVFGIPDLRVPDFEKGVLKLLQHGYHAVVRNSGGLAVVLDEGVLNISLILPGVKHISIHDCYEAMVSLIKSMLADVTNDIEAYEIVGSYCPGDYDLSIGGKKFAGISQRRIKDAAAIQIYLDVSGESKKRAAAVRDFYDVSIHGEETKFTYPEVLPEKMASLSELTGMDLSVEDMKKRVLYTLRSLSSEIVTPSFSEHEMQVYEKRLAQMEKRNEKIIALLTNQ